jgi:hypothetical protein
LGNLAKMLIILINLKYQQDLKMCYNSVQNTGVNMRSSFFKKITNIISGQAAKPKAAFLTDPQPQPEVEEKASPVINVVEPIDLSTDPSFIAISKRQDEMIKYNTEVPIKLINKYLKQFEDNKELQAKKADIILKELEGLIKQPEYKDNLIIIVIRNSVKKYGSPKVVKYDNTIHALSINPNDAKILPEIFEDFKNAFKEISLEERKDSSYIQLNP